MLPSSPMLSAHDAADGCLHHGNDCDDVAAVLFSLSSRPERSVVSPDDDDNDDNHQNY